MAKFIKRLFLGITWVLYCFPLAVAANNGVYDSLIVASSPAVITAPAAKSDQTWVLDPYTDKTLRTAFSRWSNKSNWQLVWNVKADYPITTRWVINGTFEYAVNEVLRASQQTDLPLMATMYDSNKVIEISSPRFSK